MIYIGEQIQVPWAVCTQRSGQKRGPRAACVCEFKNKIPTIKNKNTL